MGVNALDGPFDPFPNDLFSPFWKELVKEEVDLMPVFSRKQIALDLRFVHGRANYRFKFPGTGDVVQNHAVAEIKMHSFKDPVFETPLNIQDHLIDGEKFFGQLEAAGSFDNR